MTSRIVIFKSQHAWFSTQIFLGDHSELSHARKDCSCEVNWPVILRKFQEVKTLEEFRKVNDWAQSQYHFAAGRKPAVIQMVKTILSKPDETVFVNEDYAVTGLELKVLCPTCLFEHTVKYRPNGSIKAAPRTCFYCGTPIDKSLTPSQTLWQEALTLASSEPGSLLLRQCQGKYAGQPLQVLKISDFKEGKFYFDVRFRDWTVLTVPRDAIGEMEVKKHEE